mgnify:CR=1 FL=1
MAEFTKEQLQQIEAAAKEVLWPVVWTEKKARKHFSEKITPGIILAMARQILASMEREPYGYVHKEVYESEGSCGLSSDHEAYRDSLTHIPLYAAPQLPQPAVVSDSLLSELLAIAKKAAYEADECAHAEWSDGSMEHSTAIADWERRAAMLQGADGNSPDGWVACSERMPSKDGFYLGYGTFHDDAEPDHIQAFFNVKRSEWTPVEDDCVPEWVTITHWMPLPAAPQQEVKP